MLNWLAKRQIKAFGRRWNYDTQYMQEMLEAGGIAAVWPLAGLQRLEKYRHGVPLEIYYAAKIAAAHLANCGPCLQLEVSMAEAEGVATPLIGAVVRGDYAALPPDVRLGIDLTRGTMLRDASGDAAREEILRRWGRPALLSLAYAIVCAQAYPTLKYALGYGRACTRVHVGQEDVATRVALFA